MKTITVLATLLLINCNFQSADTTIFQHRLRTAIIHEIGHNIGLDHCSPERCIMSEQNGTFYGLDKSEDDYCVDYRKELKRINPVYPWSKPAVY